MSTILFLLCIIGSIIQIAFIMVERKGDMKMALILKTVAAIFFVFAGFYCMQSCEDQTRAWYVVAGLIMGAVGDVCLNLQFLVKNKDALFIAGALAFFVGHILYLISLIPYVKDILLVCFVITAVIIAFLMSWVYRHANAELGLKIFGVFYIGAVSYITVLAAGRYLLNPASMGSLIFAIGAGLFTVSDVVLIFDTFGNKKPWMRVANLTLYYAGQLTIAISLLFAM